MNKLKLRMLLEQFFLEDIGERDLSSELIFGDETRGKIYFQAKEAGVFCGKDVMLAGFRLLDEQSEVKLLIEEGQTFEKGHKLAEVEGRISALLKGERVILNLVQRMSAIATKTSEAVSLLDSEFTKVCDTRKTTPGLRMLEKYAVRTGGGYNHRYGLYDGVMIKDNHISFAGSITAAVEKVKAQAGHMVKVEVETETLEQVLEAVEAQADIIMFDNRTPAEIEAWIKHVPKHIITEASGNITLDNIAEYRHTGVHYISLGFLTHSVKALDISVKVLAESAVLR